MVVKLHNKLHEAEYDREGEQGEGHEQSAGGLVQHSEIAGRSLLASMDDKVKDETISGPGAASEMICYREEATK